MDEKQEAENVRSQPTAKDGWDKASIIAKLLTGIVFAAVGGWFSHRLSESQALVTERQLTADFVNKVTTAKLEDRPALLNAVDLSLTPENATAVAFRYSHATVSSVEVNLDASSKADDDPVKSRIVREAATTALRRIAVHQPSLIASYIPACGFWVFKKPCVTQAPTIDAQIASAILKQKSPILYLRLRDIDDAVSIIVDGCQVGPTYLYGQETDWIDLSSRMEAGPHNIRIFVDNVGGPAGVRVDISFGEEQYSKWFVMSKALQNQGAFNLFYGVTVVPPNSNASSFFTFESINPGASPPPFAVQPVSVIRTPRACVKPELNGK